MAHGHGREVIHACVARSFNDKTPVVSEDVNYSSRRLLRAQIDSLYVNNRAELNYTRSCLLLKNQTKKSRLTNPCESINTIVLSI